MLVSPCCCVLYITGVEPEVNQKVKRAEGHRSALLVLAIGYCGEVRQAHLSGELSVTAKEGVVVVRDCFVPPAGVSRWSTPSNGVKFVVLVVAKDSHLVSLCCVMYYI